MTQTDILDNLGMSVLNAMQQEAIEAFRRNSDIVLLAPTGSGKTLAYTLPLVEDGRKALVLVPSRELAAQVAAVVRQMRAGVVAVACYGGRPAMDEHRVLRELQPLIVVATPGRAADHLRKGNLRGDDFQTLVIDEFDKCLELGFREEMSQVLQLLPCIDKRVLLSATDSEDIPRFAGSGFRRLDFLCAADDRLQLFVVRSPEKDKLTSLDSLLRRLGRSQSIVFVNHRESVERVAAYLRREGFSVAAYHGGMEQRDRERQLYRFVGGAALTLVCTDLAARGLDIPAVEHVVHYHLPISREAFTHRNGRATRFDRNGQVWVLLAPDEDAATMTYLAAAAAQTLSSEAAPATIPQPHWAMIYIGRGRKDKVNRVDVVGFLSKVGALGRDELGRVDVGDHWAYAAVARHRLSDVLRRVSGQKIKGHRTIIAEAAG